MQNCGPSSENLESDLSLSQFTYQWGHGEVVGIYSLSSEKICRVLRLARFPKEVASLVQKMNHTLEKIDSLSSELEIEWWLAQFDFQNLTLVEYKFLEDFLFQAKSHMTNKVLVSEDFLCRCFKLKASEISSQLESFFASSTSQFIKREEFKKYCRAGTGCGKCEPDVVSLFSRMENENSLLFKGKNPAEWILSSSQALDSWIKRTRLIWATSLHLKIYSFDKGDLWISHSRLLTHDEELDLAQALQRFFAESDPDLCVYLKLVPHNNQSTNSEGLLLS